MATQTKSAALKNNTIVNDTVTSPDKEAASGPSPAQLAQAAKEKAQADRDAQIKSEVAKAYDGLGVFSSAVQSLGSLGLEVIASHVGATVNKLGRPDLQTWLLFVSACAFQRVSHTRFDLLCRIAVKAVSGPMIAPWSTEETEKARKAFVKVSAKGKLGASSASLRMNVPAAWDIELG